MKMKCKHHEKSKVAERISFGIKRKAQKTSATFNFPTANTGIYLYKTLELPEIHKNNENECWQSHKEISTCW